MKMLIIGDPHLKIDNLDTAGKLMLAYKQFAHDRGMRIVFLGDLYHTHAMVRSEVHQFWFDYFKDKDQFHNRPFVIIGNHDMANQVIHAQKSESPVKTLPNIIPVSSLTTYENIAFVPYCHTAEMFQQEIKPSKESILLCHQEFRGFRYETGIETSEASCGPDALKDFKLVLSGHIHKHQISGNIHYVGAPYHQKRSDWANPRHVAILDTEIFSVEYISPFLEISPCVHEPTAAIKDAPQHQARSNNFKSLDEILDFVVQSKYSDEKERRKYREIAGKYLSKSS